MDFKEKELKSELKYECFFMKLYEDDVLLPNKETSKRIYIKHEGAAAVLPITKDNEILLIKQYRYPIRQVSIEIPAGKKDEIDELGVVCAKRELEEETGYQTNDIEKFMDLHTCVGYSNEMIEMFIAYGCEQVDDPLSMDDDEFIELMKVSIDDSKNLLKQGLITDSKTVIALQHFYLNGRIK